MSDPIQTAERHRRIWLEPEAGADDLRITIAPGPECPKCHEDGFDDWWHDPSTRSVGGTLKARLKCHGCGRFFSTARYSDGETHSAMRCAA